MERCRILGALKGFINVGDINSHLAKFEQSLDNEEIRTSLANSMLVFMVRGLLSNLEFPYAQFLCIIIQNEFLHDHFEVELSLVITMNFNSYHFKPSSLQPRTASQNGMCVRNYFISSLCK